MTLVAFVGMNIITLDINSVFRFHQARDMCIFLGMEPMEGNYGPQTNPLLGQRSSHRTVLLLMRGNSLNTPSTFQRFGAVNESQKIDAHCAGSR